MDPTTLGQEIIFLLLRYITLWQIKAVEVFGGRILSWYRTISSLNNEYFRDLFAHSVDKQKLLVQICQTLSTSQYCS